MNTSTRLLILMVAAALIGVGAMMAPPVKAAGETVHFVTASYSPGQFAVNQVVQVRVSPHATSAFSVVVEAKRFGETTAFYSQTVSFAPAMDVGEVNVQIDAAARAAGGIDLAIVNLAILSGDTADVSVGSPSAAQILLPSAQTPTPTPGTGGPTQYLVKFNPTSYNAPLDGSHQNVEFTVNPRTPDNGMQLNVTVKLNGATYHSEVITLAGISGDFSYTVALPHEYEDGDTVTVQISQPATNSTAGQPAEATVHLHATVREGPNLVFIPLLVR